MSLMAMSAPWSSVFTFESTLHSSHVLHCLDEQRRRDTLCDVTVVVEGQSFRAHCSVLASCSEYFTQRMSSLTQHGAVVTLPQEVTVAGFEPLLKFAYTSKLFFGKDNVLEIQNAASILGFKDIDEACFDFLLPKFYSNTEGSAPFLRKTCCKKKCKRRSSTDNCGTDSDDVLLDEKEVQPVADSSSQQEVVWDCHKSVNYKMGSQNSTDTLAPVADWTKDQFMQCPKYRKFQIACGKESCVTEKSLTGPVIRDNCVLPCLPCSSSANSKIETEVEFPGNLTLNACSQSKPWKTEHDLNMKNCVGRGEGGRVKIDTTDRENGMMTMEEKMEHTTGISSSDISNVKVVSSEPTTVLVERSPGLISHHCPLRASNEGPAITRSLGQDRVVMEIEEDKKARDTGVLESVSIHLKAEEQVKAEETKADDTWQEREKGGETGIMERVEILVNNTRKRSTIEKEVAEYLAKQLGTDTGSSQLNFQDPEAGGSADTGSGWVQSTSLEWLKRHSSTTTSCPFFQDQDQSKCSWKGAGLSECEEASQSGVSSLNSGEDGDSETETEGDSESYARERARQVQLPFSVDWIVDLSRNDFQQLLKQQSFTREQLEFVHDRRRRSKNRLAAQRCRKRKLDCIYNLQCEISKLKTEREKLMMEKSQLSQQKLKTCHSVSALCQRVCNEANLQPEQLQVLAKYTSPDCPLSSFLPHIDALLSHHGLLLQPQASLAACSVGLDKCLATEEASSSCCRDKVTGQHSL
ncbi:transcription regulator protein BACH1b [Brachyistius frenatus]|uniref:transcription regulator protein BACH1b n=1 Tax=Brachyistius frenatus TaxID=100188 RepID=UPI0037E8D228